MVSGCGKDFEHELVAASKHLGAWSLNSNDPVPCCDRILSVPVRAKADTTLGLTVLLEAKECRTETFTLARISSNERKQMNAFILGGGVAAVLVKHVTGRTPRYFATLWTDWLEMERALGFEPDLSPSKGRRKSGTASMSLRDGERPSALVELVRVERPHSLGWTFDLAPILPAGVEVAR